MDSPKSTRELLEKYWEAETTPEEEAVLREQMQEEGGQVLGTYFKFLQEESAVTMQGTVPELKTGRVINLRRVLSIAAAICLLVVSGIVIQKTMLNSLTTPATASVDSFDDPEEAYAEAKEALLFVSQKMQRTTKQASEQLAKTQPYIDIVK